ncbi:MAG TPA: gluconate 2-dehydrogenase subunit 3 family protein [Caldimonas sp.]|nr:gluconate 2-dehydrogenase subunit 3 family protein [Caldimonas sp.]
MATVSRRIFLKASGAAALTPASVDAAQRAGVKPAPGTARTTAAVGQASHAAGDASPGYLFFNAPEAAFVEAAVVRLIPADELGPSALEAAVPTYIDRQLHGAWGAGERFYRSGPWDAAAAPTQGYQLPFTPAELFRTALRGLRDDLERTGQSAFDKLSGDDQDVYLTQLQTTSRDLAGVPSNVFFESLLAITIEGYFSDPAYGGNKDMAAWKMIGFPGAYASYYDLVDQYGVAFTAAPRGLAQDRAGHVQPMPATAAAPTKRKGS